MFIDENINLRDDLPKGLQRDFEELREYYDAGDKIKFSLRTDIKSGSLDFILYDSKGNAVYELDRAKALECFFVLDNPDTYTLTAEGSGFVGKYNMKVMR